MIYVCNPVTDYTVGVRIYEFETPLSTRYIQYYRLILFWTLALPLRVLYNFYWVELKNRR